jgi:serine/threonine protein kinase
MTRSPAPVEPAFAAAELLRDWLRASLVSAAAWQQLPLAARRSLAGAAGPDELLDRMVRHGLLTPFQARRLAVGQRHGLILGNYRVLERLGNGSAGVVFRGEHLASQRPVALKVLTLHPDLDRRQRLRFVQEVRISSRLQHPHIARALGGGVARGDSEGPALHYLVLEYVPGDDLEDRVRRGGPLSVQAVKQLARQLAGALDEGFRRRLVHRDVKPGNVRVTPAGCAKLLDYGLARWGRPELDEPGRPLGTVAYMAPEQVHHAELADVRADLYGLGGTLYWCLTGASPFPVRGGAVQQLAARLQLRPPSARLRRPEVPQALDAAVRRLLELQPADRFQTPGEFLSALAEC